MTKTSPSAFRLQTSDFRLHFHLRFYFVLLTQEIFGGNLHVKSEDLNGPEIYLIILLSSYNISCRRQHLKQDFLQRFLAKQPQKHPYKFRLRSDD